MNNSKNKGVKQIYTKIALNQFELSIFTVSERDASIIHFICYYYSPPCEHDFLSGRAESPTLPLE